MEEMMEVFGLGLAAGVIISGLPWVIGSAIKLIKSVITKA